MVCSLELQSERYRQQRKWVISGKKQRGKKAASKIHGALDKDTFQVISHQERLPVRGRLSLYFLWLSQHWPQGLVGKSFPCIQTSSMSLLILVVPEFPVYYIALYEWYGQITNSLSGIGLTYARPWVPSPVSIHRNRFQWGATVDHLGSKTGLLPTSWVTLSNWNPVSHFPQC